MQLTLLATIPQKQTLDVFREIPVTIERDTSNRYRVIFRDVKVTIVQLYEKRILEITHEKTKFLVECSEIDFIDMNRNLIAATVQDISVWENK